MSFKMSCSRWRGLAPACSSHDTGLGSADSDDTIDCALPAEVPAAWVDRGRLARQPARVGDLRCRGEWRQLGGGRRRAGVAVHRQGVLNPHFGVLDLGRRDGRGVLPEDVGRHQRRQLAAVGGDLRGRHVRGERRLIGGCRRGGLGCGFAGRSGGGLHPAQVGRDRGQHGHRRRTCPRPADQAVDRSTNRSRRWTVFRWPARPRPPRRPAMTPIPHRCTSCPS